MNTIFQVVPISAASDFAFFLLRFVLGFFFVIDRFRWIYDPEPKMADHPWFNPIKHLSLERKLCSCGWGMHPTLAGFVALVEISAGLGVLFGFLTWLSAFGLLGVLLVATYCTAKEKTMRQNPVDGIDVVSCYLWNVEPLYIAIAVGIMAVGPGTWSLDYLMQTFLQ